MLRSAIAAGFPMFSKQMFENLDVQWAGTLLGGLATIMIPIPFAFKAFGARLRSKSRLLRANEDCGNGGPQQADEGKEEGC